MSTGQATSRAHARDREIRRQVLSWGAGEWRTPGEWYAFLGPAAAFHHSGLNPAATGNELRRLQDEGLVERRVNPADKRSAQYRVRVT